MEDSSAPLPLEPNKNKIETPMHSSEVNALESSSNSEDSGFFTPNDPNKPPKKHKNKKEYKIEILKKDDKTDLKYKIIVVGNSGVGKSCLSLRATEDVFKENHQLTIGTSIYNFKVKINDKAINLQNQVEKQKNQLKLMENKAFENLKKQQDLTEKYKKELNNTIKYYENIINGRIPENF